MGAIENAAKKKKRARALRRAVLASVGVAGVLAVAAVAPNAVQLLEYTGINARLRYYTKTVLGRLKEDGDIEFVTIGGKRHVRLTEKGERRLAYEREKAALGEKKPKRWDGRYRLVMFDISEKRRGARGQLRQEMRQIGFLHMQDSAWIFPYDCEEFIALLKAELRLGTSVLYAVVDEIENDARIRAHFGLPKR